MRAGRRVCYLKLLGPLASGASQAQPSSLTSPPPPQCAYLQAKNCQVESKYLAGLRRLQEAMGNQDSECAELLRQLIQEALQWEASEASDSVELNPIR